MMPTDPSSPSTSKSQSRPTELEALRATLLAAKTAAIASIRALEVVEAFIGHAEPEPIVEVRQEGCQHDKAIEFTTQAGTFRVCECGEQWQVM